MPTKWQSSSQEIEAKWANKTDHDVFYLVLELFKLEFTKNHLSVRTDQTLGLLLQEMAAFLMEIVKCSQFYILRYLNEFFPGSRGMESFIS